MKINLFFSPTKPTGGISTWTFDMLEHIQKCHIKDICHVDASISFKSPDRHSKFKRLWSGILDTAILVIRFWHALKKYKPNCVHVSTSAGLALYKDKIYLMIASYFKVDVVFHYHFGRIPELAKCQNWEWKQLVTCVKRAKHAIVIDPMSCGVLREKGFEDKVSYIPNPCSPLVATIARQPMRIKRRNKFVFVGHVIPTKGVYELVESFTQLEEEVALEIIGLCNETTMNALMKIASQKSNGAWLSIVGNKERDYVLDHIKEAEALILPSYTEGFPNVVLEAMACGCPVLATNVGAIADMLSVDSENNACGICIPSHEIADIRNAVKQYLWLDEKRKRKYSENGKKKVLGYYTMESIFPLYEEVWNE